MEIVGMCYSDNTSIYRLVFCLVNVVLAVGLGSHYQHQHQPQPQPQPQPQQKPLMYVIKHAICPRYLSLITFTREQ